MAFFRFALVVVSVFLLASSPHYSRAAFTEKFNYQGKLYSSGGGTVPDGNYDLVFRLYADPLTATPVWTSTSSFGILFTDSGTTIAVGSATCGGAGNDLITYTSNANEATLQAGQTLWNVSRKESAIVKSINTGTNQLCIYHPYANWGNGETVTNRIYVKNGLFSTMLGDFNSLSGVDFNQPLYLGVTVGSDSEMKPRRAIGTVPSALNTKSLNGLTWDNPGIIGSTTRAGAFFSQLAIGTSTYAGTMLTLQGTSSNALLNIMASTSASALYISNGGNVGIGTNNPGSKLEVNGRIFGGSLALNTTAAGVPLEINGSGRFTNSGSGSNIGATVIDQNGGSGAARLIQYDSVGSFKNVFDAGGNSYLLGGNLGIGTTSPQATLHVKDSGSAYIVKLENSQGHGVLGIDGLGMYMQPITANKGIWFYPSSGANGMFGIASNGNVGIGTSAPVAKLEVVAPANTAESARFTSNYGGQGGYITIHDKASSTSRGFIGYGQTLFTGLSDTDFGIRSQGGLAFGDAGAVNMYIKSDGNVGIGTANPTNKLTVAQSSGGTGYSGTDGTGGIRVAWPTGYGMAIDAWDGASPRWGVVKYTANTPTVVMEGSYSNNNVIFNSGGDVGIGTFSPGAKLHVQADANTSGAPENSQLFITGSTSVSKRLSLAFNTSSNYGELSAETGAGVYAPILINPNGGNVGIGTTSPIQKLSVVGNAYMNGNATTTGTQYAANFQGNGSGLTNLDAADISAGTLVVSRGGTGASTLTGIAIGNGTSAFVGSSTLSDNFVTDGLTVAGGTLGSNNISSGATWTTGAGGLAITGSTSMAGLLYVNQATGNVGIGTTTPSQALQVNDANSGLLVTGYSVDGASLNSSILNGQITLGGNASYQGRISYNGAGSGDESMTFTNTYNNSARGFRFVTGFSTNPILTMLGNGNTGIGTSSPLSKLHIYGSDDLLRLDSSSATGNPYLSFMQNGTRRAFIQSSDTNNTLFLSSEYGDLAFKAAATAGSDTDTEYMRIAAGGNVGIGSSSPVEKLSVVGNTYMNGNAVVIGTSTFNGKSFFNELMVEGDANYRIYHNLASYGSEQPAATGTFAILTNIIAGQNTMATVDVDGYFYDATSPFKITIGFYRNAANFYQHGYINTGANKLPVFLATTTGDKVVILLGTTTATYPYPKISVTQFTQGYSAKNIISQAENWSISQVTTTTAYSALTAITDKTTLAGTILGATIGSSYLGSGAILTTLGALTIGDGGDTITINASNWDVSSAGAATFVGVNAGAGLIQGTAGLTITGNTSLAAASTTALTVSGNTILNTLTSTGAAALSSLTLTTDLSAANGGTGTSTAGTAGSVIYSNGTAHVYTAAGANGQILRSNAAGMPTWVSTTSLGIDLSTIAGTLAVGKGGTGATSLTGVIKGNGAGAMTAMTGSTNYLTKWTDANTLGASTIYDNGTNIGIGISTPSGVLDLGVSTGGRAISWGGTASNYANIWTAQSSGALVLGSGVRGSTTLEAFESSTGGNYGRAAVRMNMDGSVRFYTQAASIVTDGLFISPAERMTINSSGYVGIGTTSPLQMFTVLGNSHIQGNSTTTGALYAGSLNGLTIPGGGGTLCTTATCLTANQTITLSGDSSGSGTTGITVANNTLSRSDNRTITPEELAAGKMNFGFASWANNNSAPYADFLHMRSYTDSSGGADNLVMFSKSGIAMRIYQQPWTASNTAYSTYKDVVMTDSGSTNVSIASLTLTTDLSAANGGTGTSTAGTAGSVIYSNGTAHVYTAAGANGQILRSNAAGMPTWVSTTSLGIDLSTIAGTLDVSSGGTGVTTLTGIAIGNGINAFVGSSTLSDNYITDGLTVTGGTLGSNSLSSGATWTTLGALTIGDGGDTITMNASNWDVTNGGAATFVGVNAGAGLIQGTAGLTITGNTSLAAASTTALTVSGNAIMNTLTANGTVTFNSKPIFNEPMVEGDASYRVYHNLASYSSSSAAATGTFAILTNIVATSPMMGSIDVDGYFYDSTAPFKLTIGFYRYAAAFTNQGYINTGANKLPVFLATTTGDKVVILLGTTTTAYPYPKISVTQFTQGHSSANLQTQADGWTISQVATTSAYSALVAVPDRTTISGNISNANIGSATISSGVLWTTTGTLTIGDNGDNIVISANNWDISSAGAATFTGVNSGTGLIQGTAGLTITGNTSLAAASTTALTVSGNTILNTLTSTGAAALSSLTLTTDLSAANGGTGTSTAGPAGSVIYSNGTSHVYTAAGTTGQILWSNAAAKPTWVSTTSLGINLSTIAGTLDVSSGGTGVTTLTGIAIGNGINAFVGSSTLSDNYITDGLTVTGGTLGSNSLSSGATWTTLGTLTIGDGGDTITMNASNWDITSAGAAVFVSASTTNSTTSNLFAYGNASFANTLFVNSVTDMVGIGTNSPSSALDIIATNNSATILTLRDKSGAIGLEIKIGTSSNSNIYLGSGGAQNTTGGNNSAFGKNSLFSNTTGDQNVAVGSFSLYSNTTGSQNTSLGQQSLYYNIDGIGNTANGFQALYHSTTSDYNTALGYQALYWNTTGYRNTAAGYKALVMNTTGYDNAAFGDQALNSNVTGMQNTAVGSFALFISTSSSYNTAIGHQALYFNASGQYNTANGVYSLQSNTAGSRNSAFGMQALQSNTIGDSNVAIGHQSLSLSTSSSENVAVGNGALYYNRSGSQNIAVGSQALYGNISGMSNTAIGNVALWANTSGDGNTANGAVSLRYNTTGAQNVANGALAMTANTTGSFNVAAGYQSLTGNTTGTYNAGFGHQALSNNITGYSNAAIGSVAGSMASSSAFHNTFLGSDTNTSVSGLYIYNATAIGYNARVATSNAMRLGDTNVNWIGGQAAWSNTSDRRLKEDITDLSVGLDWLMGLKPVEYKMKNGNNRTNFGFIAQDVVTSLDGKDANIFSVDDTSDRYLSLRYTDFIAPVIKAIQEQQGEFGGIRNQIGSNSSTSIGRVEIINPSTSTHVAILVKQENADKDIASFQNANVEVMNVSSAGVVKVVGTLSIDGRTLACAGACPPALTDKVDETRGDMGAEGKVVAGAFEKYCEEGYVWVNGSAKYGTMPGFCVMQDLARQDPVNSGQLLVANHSSLSTDPWTNINQGDSQSACQSLDNNAHLLSENEWLTMAEQIIKNRANDSDASTAGLQLGATSTHYLANGQAVYDLVGAASTEWTDMNIAKGGLPAFTTGTNVDSWQDYASIEDYKGLDIMPPYYLNSTNNIGQVLLGSGADNIRGFVRGFSGIFSLDVSNPPTAAKADVGFRCAK